MQLMHAMGYICTCVCKYVCIHVSLARVKPMSRHSIEGCDVASVLPKLCIPGDCKITLPVSLQLCNASPDKETKKLLRWSADKVIVLADCLR